MLLSKRIWGGQEKTVAMKAMNTIPIWCCGLYIGPLVSISTMMKEVEAAVGEAELWQYVFGDRRC
jgi:hypothetical protein